MNCYDSSTIYKVQELCLPNNCTDEVMIRTMYESKDHADAMRFFDSYCTGMHDADGPHSNQNHGAAYFYRIVERHEV